jgi:type VI secretion system protein VasJ
MSLGAEEIAKRVQAWLEPIPGPAPAGANARYEPEYEKLLAEVAKLEAPTAGAVDWPQVATLGRSLLTKKSKDLLVAAYTGFALFAPRKALGGLLDGTLLVTDLMDRFWDSLFPDGKRMKARVNAISWFVQRATIALPDVTPTEADRAVVEALVPAAQRLAEVCRTRFTDGGPAFGPLLEALERLRLQLPPEPVAAPPSAADAQAAGPETPRPADAPPPGPVAPPLSLQTSSVPTMASTGGDGVAYFREVGTALAQAAGDLRRAAPADPLPYRVLRTGLWLHLTQAPPLGPSGRGPFPPLPATLRTQLQTLLANSKWLELLEESESALVQHRFQLDLHRFSATALASLGHSAAREALLGELGAWLRRAPQAVDLQSNDGTPVADAQTRAWIDLEARTGSPGPGPGPGGSDGTLDAVTEAKSLFASGKGSDAMALLQNRVQSADSGRSRFRLRLELAKLCAPNQPALARALYSALAKECTVHDLDTWEPALTTECLEGLLALRPAGGLSEEDSTYFQRLCRISPSAAMRIKT